jgi:hypothetical protein
VVCTGFRDRDDDRKEPELPQRHDGGSDSPLYEFDLQCSSGDALLGLYTSLKFAGTAFDLDDCSTWCNLSGVEFPHGGKHAADHRMLICEVGRGSYGANLPARGHSFAPSESFADGNGKNAKTKPH